MATDIPTGLDEVGEEFFPHKHSIEVRAAWTYLSSLHCTLWKDWLIADPEGRLKAAIWLGDTSVAVRHIEDKLRRRRQKEIFNGLIVRRRNGTS